MMGTAQLDYSLHSPGSRLAAISFIVAAHVVAVIAVASLGGVAYLTRQAQPLFVQLLPQPAPKLEMPRALPLPTMRAPELVLPSPPPLDNLYLVRLDEKSPAPPAPVVAASAPSLPTPPAPAMEPPRFNLAYLNNPAPQYPPTSRRRGEQGRVLLRVRVDAQGNAEAVEVQASSGSARLDDAALQAVRRWRFVAARVGERAVAGWALVPILFELKG